MALDPIQDPVFYQSPDAPQISALAAPCIVMACTDRFAHLLLGLAYESQGICVYAACDGQSAIDLVREHRPEVVVCEMCLPDMSGEALALHIRDGLRDHQAYIILLADADEPAERVRISAQDRIDETLVVPCEPYELMHRIQSGLRIAELQKMLAQRNEEHRLLTARLNQELSVVSNIQKSLLPQVIPNIHGFEFTWFYLPSTECGGDYFDFHQLDDNHLGFVIADVSGHGAPAMVAMALIRQDFHIICSQFRQPHLLLEELNRMLFDHLPTDQYATMFYAIINTRTLEFQYASAGHNPPVWFRASRDAVEKLRYCEGYPLKLVTRDARYSSYSIQLNHGDKMVFYTDGIPECFNAEREIYGMERFENSIEAYAKGRTPRQLETMVVTDLMCFADNHPQEDDLTLTIIGVK